MSRIIGQDKFMEMVKTIKSFPSFCILEGPQGQGKKTMANWIAETLGYRMVTIGTKIDDVRQMIADVQNLSCPIIYFIPDADTMSVGARNSLLKVTEEPPKNLYIIMSLIHSDNTLNTIKSRGRVFALDNYSYGELEEYMKSKYQIDPYFYDQLLEVASNPGEIDELMEVGFSEFIAYVDKVYANILEVSTGNSFKIADKLSFKKDDEGYSVELFLKVFQKISCDEIRPVELNATQLDEDEILRTVNIMRATNEALRELSIRGVNKRAVFDMWVLNVRRYR